MLQDNKSTIQSLTALESKLLEKGGTNEQLLMILLGIGGTGKSTVINSFLEFAHNVSGCFECSYECGDEDDREAEDMMNLYLKKMLKLNLILITHVKKLYGLFN